MSLSTKEINENLDEETEFVLRTQSSELKRLHKSDFHKQLFVNLSDLISNSNEEVIELFLYDILDPNYIEFNPEMSMDDARGVGDYIVTFHGFPSDNENLSPKLIFVSKEEDFEEAPVKEYSIGKRDVTDINLVDGSWRHFHSHPISIQQNSLMVSLQHIYESKKKLENASFFGSGWRSNLHQYLKKSPNFNKVLGSKEIQYIDGEGKSHWLQEQWYYFDENKKKVFVEKKYIFLDSDQKLKYKASDTQIYEVKYETKCDEQLTLIQGSALNDFLHKPRERKKYFLRYGFGKREITLNEDIEHHYQFYYMHESKRFYVRPSDVSKDEKGIFKFGERFLLLETDDASMTLVQQEGKNGFIFKISDAQGEIKEEFYPLEEEIIAEDNEFLDIYRTEEIDNINKQILDIREYIDEMEFSKEDLVSSINTCLCQLNLQDYIYFNQNNTYQLQKELRNKYYSFYDDLGSVCDYSIIDSYEGFTFDEVELKFEDNGQCSKPEVARNCLDAFSRLYRMRSDNLSYSCESTAHELDETSSHASFSNMTQTILKYESNLAKIENKIKNYRSQLEDLLAAKKHLIQEQKKQVNDFIIDQEGNSLGFDGYGRLILIQDKYENKIQIEFGYEAVNEGKMLSIFSESQTIKLNYDKETGVLSSIVDSRGQKTRYTYDENENLKSITRDNEFTYFDYNSGFKVTSPLETIEITENEDTTLEVKTYCYQGTIDDKSYLSGYESKELIGHEQYQFEKEDKRTTIKDVIRDQSVKNCFDEQGKLICQEGDKSIQIEFENGKNHKLQASYTPSSCYICTLDIEAANMTYNIDLLPFIEKGKVPKSNLLAIVFTLFDVFDGQDITYNVKSTVTYTTKEGKDYSEITEQTFQKGQKYMYYPICVDRSHASRLDIQVFGENGSLVRGLFTNIELISLDNGTLYTYDEEKRLVREQNGYMFREYVYDDKKKYYYSTIEFNIYGEKVTTKYHYNANDQLTCVEDSKQNVVEYDYDEKGNCIEKRSYNRKDASLMRVEKTSFDEQGRPSSKEGTIKDSNGCYPKEEVTYLPGTNLIRKIKGVNGETVCYQYDRNSEDLLSISSSSKGINNSTVLSYNYGLLTSMRHHGVKVNYVYDGRGRKVKILLNDKEVLCNQYYDGFADRKDPFIIGEVLEFESCITSTNPINNLTVESFQDKDGKDILHSYVGDDSYGDTKYTYDSEDRVKIIQSQIEYRESEEVYKETLTNDYDNYGNVICQEKKVNDVSSVKVEHQYDEDNRYIQIAATTLEERYQFYTFYQREEGIITGVALKEGILGEDKEPTLLLVINEDFEYDSLGRVKHQNIHRKNIDLCHEYSYLQQDENTLATYLIETTQYEYDVNGNIISIDQDEKKTRYFYDSCNRLIREDNPDFKKTYIYQYDKAGNLLLKKEYGYHMASSELQEEPIVTEYVYDCENRDRLISFQGKECCYDKMGRPTTYKGDKFVWNNQGQLIGIKDNIKYFYDTNGIRRKKMVGDEEPTTFITNGSRILSMKQGDKEITFQYILNQLVGFYYNVTGKEYLYQRNILGDIVAILNDSGEQVGEYAYDAYGNQKVVLDVNGIASLNPFRYRGYFWDEETNFYYLNARYYDPETGRFISPDTLSILDETRGQINGLNLYMYCGDNPIMHVDPSGKLFSLALLIGTLAGAVIGAVAGGVTAAVHGQDVLTGVLAGFAIGGIIGLGVGLSVGLIGSGAIAVASSVAKGVMEMSVGAFALATTIQDVVQIYTLNNIGFSSNGDEVTIKNSYKILSPWMQYAYSIYLNHFNPTTKDIIKGSSVGMQYEWFLHNTAYYLGIEKEHAADVSLGRSIFSDNHRGLFGNLMKISYILQFGPLFWIWDLIANGGYGKW